MKPMRTLQPRINPNESTAAHARLTQFTLVAMILSLFPSLAFAAGTWTAFGTGASWRPQADKAARLATPSVRMMARQVRCMECPARKSA